MNRPVPKHEIDEVKGHLIDEIIRLSDFSFERLPMLDILGERFAANLSAAVPDLTRVLCEASLVSLDYLPMAQITEALPSPSVLAVCVGMPLQSEIMIAIDATLLVASLELMLGGGAKVIAPREAPGFTAIERGFGARLAQLALEEFQRSLSVVCEAELELLRVESDPDSANIAPPASLCVRMRFSVAMAGHAGLMEVVIPYDALEQIRPTLSKIHFGERNEGGSIWQEQLNAQIKRAHLEMESVLTEITIPINTVMNWKIGSTIELNIEEGHEATIVCADVPMFKASLGKKNNGTAAVQITQKLELKEEL